jgi:hypothetical protein
MHRLAIFATKEWALRGKDWEPYWKDQETNWHFIGKTISFSLRDFSSDVESRRKLYFA